MPGNKKTSENHGFKSLGSLIVSGLRRIGSRIVLPGRLESKAKEDVKPVNAEFTGFFYDFPAQFNTSDIIWFVSSEVS
jgi:hypothetical protein